MALPPFGKDHAARIVALEQQVERQAQTLIELSELLGEVIKQMEKRRPGRPRQETTND